MWRGSDLRDNTSFAFACYEAGTICISMGRYDEGCGYVVEGYDACCNSNSEFPDGLLDAYILICINEAESYDKDGDESNKAKYVKMAADALDRCPNPRQDFKNKIDGLLKQEKHESRKKSFWSICKC